MANRKRSTEQWKKELRAILKPMTDEQLAQVKAHLLRKGKR